jgi:RNA polymerase sigma-70 factor, ECF subfamily
VPSVNSALQRARATIDDKLPDQSQQATLRSIDDAELQKLVGDYMEAMTEGDVDRVVSLLAEDAAWSMPPLASWFRGHDDLRIFLANGPLSGEWRWRRLPTRVNGQLADAGYTWNEDEQCFRPFAVDVLTLRGGKIQEVTAFIARSIEVPDPEAFKRWPNQPPDLSLFERLGLPDRLD